MLKRRLRSEKTWQSLFRTGVRFPSPPPRPRHLLRFFILPSPLAGRVQQKGFHISGNEAKAEALAADGFRRSRTQEMRRFSAGGIRRVNAFERRFARHRDEPEWLFMELFDDRDAQRKGNPCHRSFINQPCGIPSGAMKCLCLYSRGETPQHSLNAREK